MSAIQATVPIQTLVRLMVAAQVCQNVTLPSIQKPSLAGDCNCGTRESRVLPPGYVAFPEYGLAYKHFKEKVTFNDAMARCVGENGQLAVIDSKEKVAKIVQRFRWFNFAWVGIHLLHKPDEWATIDGNPRNDLPWMDNKPMGSGRCVQLRVGVRGLINLTCKNEETFLCEIAFPRN